jgi:hypothetical protein
MVRFKREIIFVVGFWWLWDILSTSSREAAQPTQVLGRLPALATVPFIFTAA